MKPSWIDLLITIKGDFIIIIFGRETDFIN